MQMGTHFFNRQLDFSSEPGVANENLENEPKSCLIVASFYNWLLHDLAKSVFWKKKTPIWGWAVAKELLDLWPKSQAEG